MLIGFFSLLIFLFLTFLLARDDFLFIRRGVVLDDVFNVVFLALPVVILSARVFYVFLHPSVRFLNPLVFLIIPYFPGLSIVGGIIGAWLFVSIYTKKKKMPTQRLLDILSIAFLFSLSLGIFFQALPLFFTNKLFAVEEIGRSMIGIAFFIFALTQFMKEKWKEGSVMYFSIFLYSLLAGIATGFEFFIHKNFSYVSFGITCGLFFTFLILFLYQEKVLHLIKQSKK